MAERDLDGGFASGELPTRAKFLIEHSVLIVIVLVASVLLRTFLQHEFGVTETAATLVDILVVMIALLSLVVYVVSRLGVILWDLLSIRSVLAGLPMGKSILPFVRERIKRLEMMVKGMLGQEEGIELEIEDVREITELCFNSTETTYDGTDSHDPSSFKELYPNYLECHGAMLDHLDHDDMGSRILLVDADDLRHDYLSNQKPYTEFVEWHDENDVALLRGSYDRAEKLAQTHDLPTPDVGVWHDEFALLFFPREEDGKIGVRAASPGYNDEEYQNVVSFISDLKKECSRNRVSEMPEMFGHRLSKNWDSFVNCSKRLEGAGDFEGEGPWLLDRLEPYRDGLILDAAAATGCESNFLVNNGFRVISNEIEDVLWEHAEEKAEKNGQHLHRETYDWRELTKYYTNPFFDGILCLGNSLCLLLDSDDREKVLREFYEILKPGGVFIVDERNFPYILSERESISKDPVRNFEYKGTVMYCGEAINGIPVRITDDTVKFLYYRAQGVTSLEDAEENKLGTLKMYPFKEGELQRLLSSTGFERVDRYSDFEEGLNEDADFFTYVAYKAPIPTDVEE